MNKYLNYLNDKYFREIGFEEIQSKNRNTYYKDLINKNTKEKKREGSPQRTKYNY
tara:strand:+ start:116 stop:280 length:165 start_codon:yes stop_codon:yes gene_type:complete